MTRTSLLCAVGIAAAGCGSAATGPASSTTPGGTVQVVAPTIPQGAFDVAPGELADASVYKRLRHRTRLVRQGVAYLKLDGPRADHTGHANPLDGRPMYPVIGESPERLRIVIEEDHARLALWIERRDAADTVLAPVQLADATGHAPATAGLWLGAGASLDAGGLSPGGSGFRAVTLRDRWLKASGFVPDAALGKVWLAAEREGYEPTATDDDSNPPVATGSRVAVTTLRATPDAHGDVIAEIAEIAPARIVRAAGAWTEIEIHVPRVRAHGFVPATAVTPGDAGGFGRFGNGHGFGMSDVDRVAVPAGACLYEAASGQVAGVNLVAHERYVFGGDRSPGWWPVLVDTSWGLVTAYVHDTTGGHDPKAVALESCATPAAK